MTLYSYDAAYPPTLDQLAAGSPVAVAVYLTGEFAVPSGWPAQLLARGWAPVANYEQAADELVTCGRAGGRAVGQRAMAAAQRDGIPEGSSIFYSVDVNVPPAQFEQVGQAFDGINDVTKGHYCTHVYGEGALIDYLVQTGRVCAGNWLSASSGFPGYNPQSSNVALYQLVGSPVPGTDQNIITNPQAMHVQWPTGSPYAKPTAQPEDDMTMLLAHDKWGTGFWLGNGITRRHIGQTNTDQTYADALHVLSAAGVTVKDLGVVADLSAIGEPQLDTDIAKTLATLTAQSAALETALKQVQTGGPVDLAAITAAAKTGADQALATIQITVSTPANGGTA